MTDAEWLKGIEETARLCPEPYRRFLRILRETREECERLKLEIKKLREPDDAFIDVRCDGAEPHVIEISFSDRSEAERHFARIETLLVEMGQHGTLSLTSHALNEQPTQRRVRGKTPPR